MSPGGAWKGRVSSGYSGVGYDNEIAGGSAICIHRDLLPEGAIVSYVITCHGRDHLASIRSTLRQLRGKLRLIHPHWPIHPKEMGIILGDFNICDPEEGRFNVWNQTFTDGDPGKTAVFHSFFPHVFEIAQPDYTKRDSTAFGIIRTLSRIGRLFINLPMAEARDFHCSFHVFENLGNRIIRSDHAPVRLVIQKPTNRGYQRKRIPSWMIKHPVFCFFFCSSSKTTTISLVIRLMRSQNSKFFFQRLRS